jgi:PEP-CTERM motif
MRRRLALAFALSVLFVPALAGPTFALPDPLSVQYSDPGSPTQTAWITISGKTEQVYTGPYHLYVDGLSSYWMCFDASVSVLVGSPWDAVKVDMATAATYIGAYGAEKANMIAYLANQWDGSAPSAQNRDINLAIWEIMADYDGSPGSLSLAKGTGTFSSSSYSGQEDYLTDAYNHRDQVYPAVFLLPVGSTITQPFVQPVPEPGTLLLLGSGLIGLGAWRRRNRRSVA